MYNKMTGKLYMEYKPSLKLHMQRFNLKVAAGLNYPASFAPL